MQVTNEKALNRIGSGGFQPLEYRISQASSSHSFKVIPFFRSLLCVLSKIDCLSGTIYIYKVSQRLNNGQLNLWLKIKRLNCLTCGRSAKGRYSGMFSLITLSVSSMPM